MHQREYPREGKDLGLTPPANQTAPDQSAEKRSDTSETDPQLGVSHPGRAFH